MKIVERAKRARATVRFDLFGLSLGVFASLSQVILMREALASGSGNELLIGLGFAAWLLGVGLGAAAAGRLPPRAAAAVALVAAGPGVIGCFFTARLHRTITDVPVGGEPPLHVLLGILALSLGLAGATAGFIFTAASRAESAAKRPVSRLYAVEAVGALVAGVAFPFVLAGNVAHLSVLVGAWALLAASGTGAVVKGPRRRWLVASVVAVAAVLLASGVPEILDRRAQKAAFDALGVSQELLESTDSPYGRVSLGRSHGQYELVIDGRVSRVFPDHWERPLLIDLALLQHPGPRRVLIVGGGASDRLAPALDHGVEELVLTHVDQATHEITGPYRPSSTARVLEDPRVKVVRRDGRELIAKTRDSYDVIVVAAPPPVTGGANRYHTVEFFEAAQKALRKGGSLTVEAPGGATILAPEAAQATAGELLSLERAFRHVVLSRGTKVLLHASDEPGAVSPEPEVLAARLAARPAARERVSASRIAEAYDQRALADLRARLGEVVAVPNTDVRPLSFLLNLSLWERSLPGADPSSPLTFTSAAVRLGWWTALLPGALWLTWRTLRMRRTRTGSKDSMVSLFTTGAAGMTADVLALYAYQTASGRLYQGLALMVGLFMIGVAAGTILARRRWATGTRRIAVATDAWAAGFFAASAPIVHFGIGSVPLLWAFCAASGFITGIAFPVYLARACVTAGGDERRHAAKAEAADHYGAAFGALLGGVVWLPVLGVARTCLVLAGLKLLSAIGHAAVPARRQ